MRVPTLIRYLPVLTEADREVEKKEGNPVYNKFYYWNEEVVEHDIKEDFTVVDQNSKKIKGIMNKKM